MNNKADPGLEYADSSLYFTSRIKGIEGQTVTLERAVPWAVKAAFEPCECGALGEAAPVRWLRAAWRSHALAAQC